MSLPVESALVRRERIWPVATASVLVHAMLVGWALLRAPPPQIDLQKPIAAKLVRIGEKKPQHFLPEKPVVEAAAPTPPRPTPAPIPAVAAPPVAPLAPPAPTAKAPPKAATPPPPPAPAAPVQGTGTSVSSILSSVKDRVARDRWGDPDGDAMGDSSEGTDGDRYIALVVRAIQQNYNLPHTISDRDRLHLNATVVLFIEPDGRIARWRVEKPSGNGAFDDALERTLRNTARLPPPPDSWRQAVRDGVAVLFKAT